MSSRLVGRRDWTPEQAARYEVALCKGLSKDKKAQRVYLQKVRVEDRGNGIITGHPVEPIYGRTYLPKKFKIAFTVPGDNGVDLYINDIGCVVIMEPDGQTLKGFNIVVGGGMGRTHRK